jgi:hypothetical protein
LYKQDESAGYTAEAQILLDSSDVDSSDVTNGSTLDDRKPAALRPVARSSSSSTNRSNRHPPNAIYQGSDSHRRNVQFPDLLGPGVGEVVSIQDERDIHPFLRAENRLHDSEAELVRLVHSFAMSDDPNIATVSASGNHDSYLPYLSPDVVIGPTLVTTASFIPESLADIHPNETIAVVANSESFLLENTATAVTARNTHMATSNSNAQEAEIVGIQDDQDIHPSDLDAVSQRTASAELVSSVNYLSMDSVTREESTGDHHGSPVVATVVATARTPFEDWPIRDATNPPEISLGGNSFSGGMIDSPVIIASAFTDPHQPFNDTTTEVDTSLTLQDDEDIARTLQEAEHVARIFRQDEDIARTLQEQENDANFLQTRVDSNGETSATLLSTESVSDGVVVSPAADVLHSPSTSGALPRPTSSVVVETPQQENDEYNTDWLGTSIPERQRVASSSREVSHDSAASESNGTVSSQRSNQSSVAGNIQTVSYIVLSHM